MYVGLRVIHIHKFNVKKTNELPNESEFPKHLMDVSFEIYNV